jgi:acyl-CoA synthetase (AMP-forming)/AMP-acid ligase II
MSLEFYKFIKQHAGNNPNHPAIIDGKTTITYGQLLEQAECFAGGLTNFKLNTQSKIGYFV